MSRFVVILGLLIGSMAWGKDDRMVSVAGNCFRSVTPDRGSITLTAESTDAGAGTASQKAIEQYNKIRERVKKMNLKNLELETTEFSVNEDFDWANNVRKSRGFRARMGLRVVSSETTRMGDVAALAAELKVREVSGLQSSVSPELMRSEREACLEEALKNARAKAEKLAKISGMKLGNPFQISEEGSSAPPRPYAMAAERAMMKMSDDGPAAPVVEAGVSKLSVTVHATYELL